MSEGQSSFVCDCQQWLTDTLAQRSGSDPLYALSVGFLCHQCAGILDLDLCLMVSRRDSMELTFSDLGTCQHENTDARIFCVCSDDVPHLR